MKEDRRWLHHTGDRNRILGIQSSTGCNDGETTCDLSCGTDGAGPRRALEGRGTRAAFFRREEIFRLEASGDRDHTAHALAAAQRPADLRNRRADSFSGCSAAGCVSRHARRAITSSAPGGHVQLGKIPCRRNGFEENARFRQAIDEFIACEPAGGRASVRQSFASLQRKVACRSNASRGS
jgi:hypothetical protein